MIKMIFLSLLAFFSGYIIGRFLGWLEGQNDAFSDIEEYVKKIEDMFSDK